MDDLAGKRLASRYQLVALLNDSKRASVYKAIDEQTFRTVAIKVVWATGSDREAIIERFRREAQISLALNHPHILKSLDYGFQEDFVFLVMTLVEGSNLRDVINTSALPLNTIGALLSQITSALDYIHARGVIHCDLKSQNILFDQPDHVLLTDFGSARLTDNTNSVGPRIGTPNYMAPEQWRGGILDRRVDLYALGVILYEMVCGTLPFISTEIEELERLHLTETPVPLRLMRPGLPAALQAILDRALAKAPTDRFTSAGEIAAAYTRAIS